jgi:hypothetical protein
VKRLLNRNKREYWFRNYVGLEPIRDEWGNESGEHRIIYSDPVQAFANISAAKGEAEAEVFGNNLQYDKSITLTDVPFTENCVLFIDRMPVIEDDGTTKTVYDYVVTRIAQSLNYTIVAVSKVNLS